MHTLDRLAADIAARQHGVVWRPQLLRAGLDRHAVQRLRRTGWLDSIHRGVYRVGPVAAPRTNEMAALLACGFAEPERTGIMALARRTAAVLLGMLQPQEAPARVEVIGSTIDRRRPRICVMRDSDLQRDEVAEFDGMPITTRARTLLDLAGVLARKPLERAFARAERDGLVATDVAALLARHPRLRGAGVLAALIDGGAALTRSPGEEALLDLVASGGLPKPEVNVMVEGFEVDTLWRSRRLIAEVDGFAYHSDARAFERDRLRDSVLTAAGYRVMRLTWHQITKEPHKVLVRLAGALAR